MVGVSCEPTILEKYEGYNNLIFGVSDRTFVKREETIAAFNLHEVINFSNVSTLPF